MTTQARIDTHPQGAAIVQIDNSKHANTLVVCAVISGICLCVSVVALYGVQQMIMENRITQQKLDKNNAELEVIKRIIPEESWQRK